MPDVTRLLYDIQPVLAGEATAPAGVVWRLAEIGRQLDADVLNQPAGQTIGSHTEPDLDVLVLVVAGSGTLNTDSGPLPLTSGALVWMPHGSPRSLAAGINGLAYLTVHRRRPGMQIRTGA